MPTFSLYRQAQLSAWSGQVNWAGGTITATLHTSAYTPNMDTHRYVADLSGELASGAGYTLGGKVLAGRTSAYLPAGSWPDTWAPVTGYVIGQVVRPALSPSMLFRCYSGGSSGSAAPAWPAVPGGVVTDGTVSWSAIGAGAVALAAAALQWASFTAGFRYIVLSDRTNASPAAQPLLAVADMGGTASGSGGNLDVIFDAGFGSGIAVPLWSS